MEGEQRGGPEPQQQPQQQPALQRAERVVISGAVLSSVLHEAASAQTDFDGFIFGYRAPLQEAPLGGDDDIGVPGLGGEERTELHITGLVCGARPCAFFSVTGAVDEAELAARQRGWGGRGSLLGWLAFHAGREPRASARDVAVSAALPAALRGACGPAWQACSLLGLFAYGGAGTSKLGFRFRFYQQTLERGRPVLQPVSASILSLREPHKAAYRQPHETAISGAEHARAPGPGSSLPLDGIWARGGAGLRDELEDAAPDFESVAAFRAHVAGAQAALERGALPPG